MPLLHALVLGIVQGLAEFLPISSSGHLELTPWLFGWDDFGGDTELENAFDVALHMGTTAGAVAYLWGDVRRLTVAGFAPILARRPLDADGRTAWYFVLSAVPAGILGLSLEGVLLDVGERVWVIAVCLIVFGLVLWATDRAGGGRSAETFGWRDALVMGTAQALALVPGVSRSGSTISAARVVRFDRPSATRLAFLMSLPVIAGAGVVRGAGVVADGGVPGELVGGFVVGMAASAVTGWLAVWGLLRFVRTRTFTPFVVYRVVAGVGVLALLATSYR